VYTDVIKSSEFGVTSLLEKKTKPLIFAAIGILVLFILCICFAFGRLLYNKLRRNRGEAI
jgi:hypothetical protein